jgi:uncharacterized OB-fold protein
MSETYEELPAKPQPQIAPGNEPYWQALREHRLVIQRCANCKQLRHYPRPMCDACYSMEFDWQELPARGHVHSWTVTHHPFHPGFKRDVPYVTVTVDLESGIRLQTPLLGVKDHLALGTLVDLEFIDVEGGATIPCARIAPD